MAPLLEVIPSFRCACRGAHGGGLAGEGIPSQEKNGPSRSRSERPASRGHRRINRPCWHYAPNPLKSRPPVKGRHNQTDPLPPCGERQGGGMQHVRKLTPSPTLPPPRVPPTNKHPPPSLPPTIFT